MTLRPILIAPDPRLKQVSEPVKDVTDDLRTLMDDMLETMYDAPGIGLAAIQVGVPKRVLVMDIATEEEGRMPRYFVNPEIFWESEELSSYQEGCLSVPESFGDVDRPAEVKVRYLDYKGEAREIHATGLLATCIQHEMDHLNGVLFIDHLSKLKRDMLLKKLEKLRKTSRAA
jgi:peptide deformylase